MHVRQVEIRPRAGRRVGIRRGLDRRDGASGGSGPHRAGACTARARSSGPRRGRDPDRGAAHLSAGVDPACAVPPLRDRTCAARGGRADHARGESCAPRPAARRRADQAARRRLQQLRRRQRIAAAGLRQAGERGERAHRTGAQPPCGADVGALAERDHVQPRGAHPAVQRPRDAAAAQAARQRGCHRKGAQPGGARALDLRHLRSQPDHPCARQRPRPAAAGRPRPDRELRHNRSRGAARTRAAGARRRCGDRSRVRRRGPHFGVRSDARQHHAPGRDRQSPRPPAADADAGHPRVARQHARRHRDDRVVPRHGHGGTGQIHRHHRRGGAAPLRQARRDGRRIRRFVAHRVASRRHARRRPDRGCAAQDRDQARAADEARDRRRIDLAQRRQLLADAGDMPISRAGCARNSAYARSASAWRRPVSSHIST